MRCRQICEMVGIKSSQWATSAGYIAVGSLAVALITTLCFSLRLDFAIPRLLFLMIVVALSLWDGFLSSAIVSVIAVLCLEYFFVPPVLEWQIDDPQDGIALVTYWITSLVITRLASRARREANVAERRKRDVESLYEAASRLFSLGPETGAGKQSLGIFREVFELRAACFFDGGMATLYSEGNSRHDLAGRTRDSCIHGKDYQDPGRELYVRCLYTRGRVIGAIGFEGRFHHESIPLALSALAAATLERTESFRKASRASADAQAEMLRSAILDALAHEFKTPLAIILAAAGGLREISSQSSGQAEMTDIIEDQTLRVSRLAMRLLRVARLDREEVRPIMELTSLHALLTRIIEQFQSQFGRRITAKLTTEHGDVEADPELLELAIGQLLDNALKYSLPETVVTVSLEMNHDSAVVLISNEGNSIPPHERERIFERFFRGSETEQNTPGTGLGLYVARKIVRAHEGTLDLQQDQAKSLTTTFRICLPISRDREQNEQQTYQSTRS